MGMVSRNGLAGSAHRLPPERPKKNEQSCCEETDKGVNTPVEISERASVLTLDE